MSQEIKLIVEPVSNIDRNVVMSKRNANRIGLPAGGVVELFDAASNKSINAAMVVDPDVEDSSIKVDFHLLNEIDFDGVEITVRSVGEAGPVLESVPAKFKKTATASTRKSTPGSAPSKAAGASKLVAHKVAQAPKSTPPPPRIPSTAKPTATKSTTVKAPPVSKSIASKVAPAPKIGGAKGVTPKPPTPSKSPARPKPATSPPRLAPGLSSLPQAPSMPGLPQVPIMPGFAPSQAFPTYPTAPGIESSGLPEVPELAPPPTVPTIDVNSLASEKNGIVLIPRVQVGLTGKVKLNPSIAEQLGLAEGMLVGWEDPMSRATGAARITADESCPMSEIWMSDSTRDETDVRSPQVAVYSTEPPIEHRSALTVEVEATPDLMGYAFLSPRSIASLSMRPNDIIVFEDALTGAIGAAKVNMREDVEDNKMVIDAEILEASGIGSFEVEIKQNFRPVIPLQSVDLGISPIQGENMWETISMARQNADRIKMWLANYVIFKGIKLRWKEANTACQLLDCVPSLEGDVFAAITPTTTLTLKPTGLITFNAILIIDISRSMMARDVQVVNVAPAIEGIKAAMESKEIQTFMKNFKEGVAVPRRMSAAFAAILFLSEKVGRGFGEKVSIIRFADDADIINFSGKVYMDSASGKKGVLEEAARKIVDLIGNAYGQATNMGIAMKRAQEVLTQFDPNQPTMIVLLTDGVPTDGNDFFTAIQEFSENPNVVLYIIGLGNPDDEAMKHATALCGGEYFKPNDSGELLVWYSKRARDLQVKLKAHKR